MLLDCRSTVTQRKQKERREANTQYMSTNDNHDDIWIFFFETSAICHLIVIMLGYCFFEMRRSSTAEKRRLFWSILTNFSLSSLGHTICHPQQKIKGRYGIPMWSGAQKRLFDLILSEQKRCSLWLDTLEKFPFRGDLCRMS